MLAATTAVILLGFGVASLIVYNIDVGRYAPVLTATSLAALLNAIMLGLAMVISILTKRKSTATGIAIFMWFLFTVLSDLGFLSIVLNLKAGAAATLPVILLNPVETSRIFAVLSLGGAADQLGSTDEGRIIPALLVCRFAATSRSSNFQVMLYNRFMSF